MNPEKFERIEPRLMRAVLPALTDPGEVMVLKRRQTIPVGQIIAQAWHPGRLQEAVARLQAGDNPPMVDVNRYYLHGETYYTVNDGHHRVVAARQLGRAAIDASIRFEAWCQPQAYRVDLDQGRLWRKDGNEPDGLTWQLVLSGLEPELMLAFQKVGVNLWR
jgi:uncharacterized ParB-like nuclease family protein